MIFELFFSLATSVVHPATLPAKVEAVATQPGPQVEELGDGFYALIGGGGTILVSTGPDGAFVVDNQFARNAAQNLAAIDKVSDTPVVFVLNTHHHGDHSGGNAAFYAAGATVISHDNVRTRIAAQTEDPAALPSITFEKATTFHWNGQAIHLQHLPAAHTDGDAIVRIKPANLIHTGDILFSGRYPFIDLESGGTVEGTLDALTAIADMADAETKIVPGHGPVASKADLQADIAMLRDARERVRQAMEGGKSLADVLAATPLAQYDEKYAWQFIDSNRMVTTLYNDLNAQD